MKAKFQHNCEHCIYLGSRDINPYPPTDEDQEYWVDFYICPNENRPGRFSFVARNGNGPHEYESLTAHKDSISCYEMSYEIELCVELARERGVI